jgi:hypothetical protein
MNYLPIQWKGKGGERCQIEREVEEDNPSAQVERNGSGSTAAVSGRSWGSGRRG